MGIAQRGEHTNGGLDDIAQCCHLTRLTDTCLEERHLTLCIQEPHTEGHTYLRVITTWGTGHHHRGREELIEPFLHHRPAIAACESYYGDIKLITMTFCQSLKCFQWTHHNEEVGIRIVIYGLWQMTHHKIPHSTPIEVADIPVTVIAC